jgi:general secretion pathway protein A
MLYCADRRNLGMIMGRGRSNLGSKTMDSTYLSFYRFFGLHENPFNVNPDPEYLFLNQRTQNVLSDLLGAIEARKGLMVITGDVGTGKTTVLNYLMRWLKQQRTPVAFVFNPGLQVRELFDVMLASFAVPPAFGGGASALLRLNQWLLDRYQGGTNAVLMIDEAQRLPVHMVEEIRMLLNQETPHEKLLQIVLCGQPELEANLNRPDFRYIRQRISLRCKMTELSQEDTRKYIEKRLHTAGATDAEIFTTEAIAAVHSYSSGIPRVTNLLCEHALMRAYLEQTRPVGACLIDHVARQLQLEGARPAAPAVASLIGGKFSEEFPEETPVEGELQTSASLNRAIAMESVPLADAMAQAEKDFLEASALKDFAAYQLDSVLSPVPDPAPDSLTNRRLQVVGSPPQTVKVSSKLVEMSRGGVRKPEAAAAEQPVTLERSSSHRKKTHVAFPLADWAREIRAFLLEWKIPIEGALQESWRQLEPMRAGLSRWSRNAREFFLASGWETYADSLLRWLQQPMSTVKVQRRMRE